MMNKICGALLGLSIITFGICISLDNYFSTILGSIGIIIVLISFSAKEK